MDSRVVEDLDLLRTGLEALGEAAEHGNVTVVVLGEDGRALNGDLPTLIVKMGYALRRVEETVMAKRRFIKEAIKKPGALTASVRRLRGKGGFTKRGTIRVSVLRDLSRNARNRKTRKRARLALTLRELGKK